MAPHCIQCRHHTWLIWRHCIPHISHLCSFPKYALSTCDNTKKQTNDSPQMTITTHQFPSHTHTQTPPVGNLFQYWQYVIIRRRFLLDWRVVLGKLIGTLYSFYLVLLPPPFCFLLYTFSLPNSPLLCIIAFRRFSRFPRFSLSLIAMFPLTLL